MAIICSLSALVLKTVEAGFYVTLFGESCIVLISAPPQFKASVLWDA
jgi:hypothetical protein